MNKTILFSLSVFISAFLLTACKKTDSNTANNQTIDTSFVNGLFVSKTGSLQINFTYSFGQTPLVFNSKNYVNASYDTITITDLKHYFSNFSLQKADSTWLNFNNCNLIDVKAGRNMTLNIPNVPAGNYRAIAFDIGIDKVRNSSMSLMGDLDPAWGMYWTWSTGYVFFRIMGNLPPTDSGYSLDLGGDNNLPHIELPLTAFKVKTESPQLTLNMDINEIFQNPNKYSLVNDGMVIHSNTAPGALKIAQNMLDMASVTSLK
jgi:hypothetical protein